MFGVPRPEQAHFADVVADLGLPVDAQLEDIRIATRYVCSLTLVQLEMLFARVAEPWWHRSELPKESKSPCELNFI